MTFIDLDRVLSSKRAVLDLLAELEIKKMYNQVLQIRYKEVAHQADIILTEWEAHHDSAQEQEGWGELSIEDDDAGDDTADTFVDQIESEVEEALGRNTLEFAVEALDLIRDALEQCEADVRSGKLS